MTPAGRVVELKRYRIPSGERALQAQRIDGRVALMDVPVDHDDRVYLVERHIESHAELHGLAAEYAQRSEACGIPAVLAILRTAEDLAEGIDTHPEPVWISNVHKSDGVLPELGRVAPAVVSRFRGETAVDVSRKPPAAAADGEATGAAPEQPGVRDRG